MEIKNAVIESVTLEKGDRGFLQCWLHLSYGGSGQGFGGYVLYLPKSYSHHELNSIAGHFIFRCMEIAGVERWEHLPGRTIRVRSDLEKVHSIGHIVKDDWFDPTEDFSAKADAGDESEALRDMLDSARSDLDVMRNALGVPVEPHQSLLERMVEAAQAKRELVPDGYDIAPVFRGYARLGIGQYVLHNCPQADDERPSLVIAIATEEEKADRQVGELRHVTPGLMIQPDRIAVRLDFENAAALDALEQQLRFLREDSFPDSLAAPAPAPAKVSMPERLADAIVREVAELPDRDSPADWPAAMLVTSDELRGIVRAALHGEAKPAKCDGNHGGPRCADPECWNDGPIALILDELRRAVTKFPTWPTDPLHALTVLGEEFGELTKATLQTTYEPHKSSHDDVRTEAIQTAAMALRFVISLERYEYTQGIQHQQEGQPA